MTPPRRRRLLFATLAVAIAAAVLAGSGCALSRIRHSAALARDAQAPASHPPAPALRLLIVGDSTAAGTGAAMPSNTVAGRLALAFPRLDIVNRGRNGARFADLLGQLDDGERFDMVLVMAGGNDVIRVTPSAALRRDVDAVLQRARRIAPQVVLLPCGNVGNAPFFDGPWLLAPLAWWMTRRSRVLHADIADAAARHGAVYVSLFREHDDDEFVRRPELNASDGLHPADEGYEIWWRELTAQAQLRDRLAAARIR